MTNRDRVTEKRTDPLTENGPADRKAEVTEKGPGSQGNPDGEEKPGRQGLMVAG